MNPAKEIDYPSHLGLPENPREPDVDEDSEDETPVEHALYTDD